LRDDPDGTKYALLFVNASSARNEVDPHFALAGPEISHHAMASGYYQHVMDTLQTWRALNPQDIVAVHWYGDGPPLLQYLDAVHAAADRYQVWLSETGYSTADLDRQADFYRSMLESFASSRRAWWTHLIFYRLWDGTDCCSEALLTANFTAKPAFDAIRSWLDQAPGELDDPNPYIPRTQPR
jgi:putative glycosyl hydrolase